MKKKNLLRIVFLLSILISIIVLVPRNNVYAREFEVGWPDLPRMDSPTTVAARGEEVTIPYFFSYIFNFALMIVGIVALLMLILNAIRYMTSTVAPAKRGEAIEGMKNIGYGLLILLASFIILNTINPELFILATPEEWARIKEEANPVVLYDDRNCQGNSLGIDEDVENLTDLDWNDKTVSFKVKTGQVARLCRHAGGNPLLCEGPAGCTSFCDCRVIVGDGQCKNAATWEGGFLSGCPPLCALCLTNPNIWRLTSVSVEDYNKDALLIVFSNTDLSGEHEVLAYQTCKVAERNFGSYWLNANNSAILCNSSWDGCSQPPLTTGVNPTYANRSGGTLCAYKNDTTNCLGFYFNSGPNFVPTSGPCVALGSNDTSVTPTPSATQCSGRTILLYNQSNCTSSEGTYPTIYTYPGGAVANPASGQSF